MKQCQSEVSEVRDVIRTRLPKVSLNTGYVIAYVNRGSVRDELGDPEGAIADYTKAIELDPGNLTAYYSRARARANSGRVSEAAADSYRALDLAPADWPARREIEEFLRKTGQERKGK